MDYAAGHTDLYVEQFSMGQSQGDSGLESLDMPYLIVAKDKAAVDKWQEIKAEARRSHRPAEEAGEASPGRLPGARHVLQYSTPMRWPPATASWPLPGCWWSYRGL